MPNHLVRFAAFLFIFSVCHLSSAHARGGWWPNDRHCEPDISFVEFPSFDLQTQSPIVMKGKLMLPSAADVDTGAETTTTACRQS